jgi:hypothetical protein
MAKLIIMCDQAIYLADVTTLMVDRYKNYLEELNLDNTQGYGKTALHPDI